MTGLVCETLQAVLKSVEVFKQDLQADDFKPAAPDLVVSSPSAPEEVDKALFGLHRSLIVFAFKLQLEILNGYVRVEQVGVLALVDLLHQRLLVDLQRLRLRLRCLLLNKLLSESLDQGQTTVCITSDLVVLVCLL